MRIIDRAGYRQMLWKNGAGTTTEIAVWPANATTDDFDWRISMARVGADGWFSKFPEIDRTLSVLEGEGIDLSICDTPPARLSPASSPYSFPADTPVFAKLVDGPIIDLNVMTRRGRFIHRLTMLETASPFIWQLQTWMTVVFCYTNTLHLDDGAHTKKLSPLDSAFCEIQNQPLRVTPEGRARIYFVEIIKL